MKEHFCYLKIWVETIKGLKEIQFSKIIEFSFSFCYVQKDTKGLPNAPCVHNRFQGGRAYSANESKLTSASLWHVCKEGEHHNNIFYVFFEYNGTHNFKKALCPKETYVRQACHSKEAAINLNYENK